MSDIEKFVSTLSSFFDNIGIIIDDLNKRGYQQLSPQQIEIMKTYVLSKDREYLINSFIENTEQYWNDLKTKSEQFFLDNSASIFGDYSNHENVNSLKFIFSNDSTGQPLLDDATKDIIKQYLHSLIRISIKHVFHSKNPTVDKQMTENGNFKTKITFKSSKYPTIKITDHARNWDVKLW